MPADAHLVSSVQNEFEPDRGDLAAFIEGDAVLGRFFRTFLFERDIVRLCAEVGLPDPDFRLNDGFTTTLYRPVPATDPVADPVADPIDQVVIALARGALAPSMLREALGLKHRPTFRKNDLRPALEAHLVEATIPDKPVSRLQKYRLTGSGQARFEQLQRKGDEP